MKTTAFLVMFFWFVLLTAATIQELRAEEPTQEVVLEQCIAVVEALSDGLKGIKQHVLETCSNGGTFEAVDGDGVRHKFCCSKVIEL